MRSFEDIQKANESIRTLGITRRTRDKTTGEYIESTKEYAEVNQRVKAFRMIYPDGAITSEIINCTDEIAIIKATIYDDTDKILATGYAREEKKASNINVTSYLENCETSAIGRALGFCGFGIDTSIASYEEIKSTIEKQEPKQVDPPANISVSQWNELKKLYGHIEMNNYLKTKGYTKISQISYEEYLKIKNEGLNNV